MKSVWKVLIISLPIVLMIVLFMVFIFPFLLGPSFHHTKVTNTILIDSDGDFIENQFSGSGTLEEPYIIENRVFGVNEMLIKNFYIGLEITGTTKYFIVRNCTFFGGRVSLKISNIAKGTALIHNNYFYSRDQAEWDAIYGSSGMNVINSSDVIIENNVFNCTDVYVIDQYYPGDSGYIVIEGSDNVVIECNSIRQHRLKIMNSKNSSINSNQLANDSDIYIENSPYSKIYNNNISTDNYGLTIDKSSHTLIQSNIFEIISDCHGIVVSESNYLSITDNTILRDEYDTINSRIGIYLTESCDNLISYNLIRNFTARSIVLRTNSNNNIIFHNSLYNNTKSIFQSQGYDECFGNIWYNPITLEGNYWNNLGSNSTYTIAGSAGSIDLYPLTSPII